MAQFEKRHKIVTQRPPIYGKPAFCLHSLKKGQFENGVVRKLKNDENRTFCNAFKTRLIHSLGLNRLLCRQNPFYLSHHCKEIGAWNRFQVVLASCHINSSYNFGAVTFSTICKMCQHLLTVDLTTLNITNES